MAVGVAKPERLRPPGPFQPTFWRSPLRGPWLTATLGLVLLVGLPIVMATGLLSNVAWDPRFAANVAGQDRVLGPFDVYLFSWPAHPSWLYAATQGIHVGLGLALVPVVLVKQWSVLPRLFAWPVVRGPAQALERLSLLFLVGGIFFEFVTGILFDEYWFPFRFTFDSAHYYGAWVFFGALIVHVAVRLGRMRRGLATRRALAPLRTSLAGTVSEAPEADRTGESLVPVAPAPATMSRRALLGTVGAAAALLGLQGAAQAVGGPVRSLAFMLPRGRTLGAGPNDFPVNGTMAFAGISADDLAHWRMGVRASASGAMLTFTRDQLLALPQHTHWVPLTCREGWSTTQRWTGVRLRDLAAAIGMHGPVTADIGALDDATVTLASNQVAADETLLVLQVNGADLSHDHGFPARMIVPGDIAVNCLKWVNQLTFHEADRT